MATKSGGIRIVFLIMAFVPSVLATTAGSTQTPWYQSLEKPWFQPPGWLFGPVWTVLYTFIGVAGWRIWRAERTPRRKAALTLWTVQLLLNAAWSPIFFGLQRPDIGLAVITAMWLTIAGCIALFRGVDRVSSWLFVPYLAWISFATALNASYVV